MNSKQRRQDARKWKYYVKVSREQVDQNGYDNMFDWCRDTWGNGRRCAGWREKHRYIGTWWQFRTSEQATLFALKFGAA